MFKQIRLAGNHGCYAILMFSLCAVNSWCPSLADDVNIAANNTNDNVGKLPEDTKTPVDPVLGTLARTIKQEIWGNAGLSTKDGKISLAVDLRTANDERLAKLQRIVGDVAPITILDLSQSQISDSALSHLSSFKTLQFLNLNETQIGDSGLEHLRDMTSLTTLYLNRTRVTDTGLQHLVGLHNLREISLSITNISDAGLKYLAALPNLESLVLTQTQISDAGLKHLADLKKLKSLGLGFTKVTDAGLIQIGQMQNLQAIDVCGMNVTDQGLAHLTGLNRLESLNYHTTKITRAGHDRLFAVFQSRREELIKQGYEKVRERELPVITKLEKLGGRIVYDENKIAKELMLDDSGVTDDDLQEIETLSDLTNVRLSNTKITKATVRRLGNLSKLEQIDLSNTQITDDAIASLTTLQYLFSLDLSKTSITGSELPSLKSLQRLFSLSLDHTMINDRGLEYLEPLKTLRVLSLSNTQVSDRGLELLGSRTELIGLFLDNTNVTDNGLKHLNGMSNLSSLGLSGTNVTDGGLRSLSRLSSLEALGIGETPATKDGVLRFDNLAEGDVPSRRHSSSFLSTKKPDNVWTRCDLKAVSDALLMIEDFEVLAVNAKRRLALGYRSSDREQLHLIELDTGVSIATLPRQVNRVHFAEFSGDGEVLAIYGNVIRLWKIGTKLEEIANFNSEDTHFSKQVLLTYDGKRAARVREDGVVMIYDRKSRAPTMIQEQIHAPDGRRRQIRNIAMSPDAEQLAFSSLSVHEQEFTSEVSLWDVDTQRNTHRIVVNRTRNHMDGQWPVDQIEYSHDGSLLAFWRNTNNAPSVALYKRATGEVVVRLEVARAPWLERDGWEQCRCAFSPDDKLFVAAQSRGLLISPSTVIHVWSTESGKLLSTVVSGGGTDHVFVENDIVTLVGRQSGLLFRISADWNRSRKMAVIDWNLPAVIESGKKHLAIAHFRGETVGIQRGGLTD